ncbi:hypothetical protein l11_17830 [Neisseria weaveri LMG 5135]|nr:hypothetical protein l11_17830 [Neisseria weaveri LMG 5135]
MVRALKYPTAYFHCKCYQLSASYANTEALLFQQNFVFL